MAAVAPEEPRSVEEPPAPVLGVGEEMEAAPRGQEMERAYEGTARGSVESLGRGLLSTDEISGDYSAPGCVECKICNSMTVVPLGPDAIETWRTGCLFCPPFIGPFAEDEVRTRNPGTNAFGDMTFSADGTASGGFKRRPDSQKRAFQKVDARDLAGKWGGCCCNPFVPCWPLSQVFCTTKKALNEDQYEEKGLCCFLCLPCPVSETHTRIYVNGHATNGFAKDPGAPHDVPNHDILWYRDPGCAGGLTFAKKVG